MAMWHLRSQVIGRGKGKSAIAAAAYRAGEAIHSEYADIVFDYTKKRGIEFSEILAPENASTWVQNRKKLWNRVEAFEKRKDAQLAREIELSLPIEFSLEQSKDLLREYIKDNFVNLGMIADYSIHDVNRTNPHAHIMLTLRPILKNEFTQKERAWNSKEQLEHWREEWANLTNKHLALNGIDQRISHLSYAEQGIDLEPTIHRGVIGKPSRSHKHILERFEKIKALKERNYIHLLSKPEVIIDLLTYHEAVFNHHDLAKLINERTNDEAEFTKLKLAVENSPYLVRIGQGLDGKEYYTSKRVLEQERSMLDKADKLAKSKIHQINPAQMEFVLQSHNLNVEQEEAFRHILSGNDLSLLVGFAGTGKSYLLNAVREAYEAKGYTVQGAALSGKAADGLRKSANINSKTIARRLIDWENDRAHLDDKTVLIVDEAGMVGTRQLEEILHEAVRAGAKIIACGDPEQILPIESGCPFRVLLERIKHVFLKQVIRQREDWQKQATVELSTRKHNLALDRYYEHDCVFEHGNSQEALNAVINSWFKHITSGNQQTAIMMSYRNKDVLEMNLKARELLIGAGLLKLEQTTKIETSVFGELEFAVGDRLMFLRNENSLQVKNGLLGKISAISQTSITVELDRGDTIAFDTKAYNDLAYGYASTIHKMQGETIDKSFVLATKHFDRFLTNVALDRHKESTELHYGRDDFRSFDNLKRVLSRGDSKVLAVEFAQSRGLDYELEKDLAAQVEAKTDFTKYYELLLAKCVAIKNSIAEKYFASIGLDVVEAKNVNFHPEVWERETQCFMPAIVAKAVGFDKQEQIETKGVQITYIDLDTKGKANITYPIKYSGSSDAIVMVQKALQPEDNKWYVTMDVETALALKKANSNIRITCLASCEMFDENPINGSLEEKQQVILCANQNIAHDFIKKFGDVFSAKNFDVYIAQPKEAQTFQELLKVRGSDAICKELLNAKKIASMKMDRGVAEVLSNFAKLDKNISEAVGDKYYAKTLAQEAVEKYALTIGHNRPLLEKIHKFNPQLCKRINAIIEAEKAIDLE